jgi:hypothetical protein
MHYLVMGAERLLAGIRTKVFFTLADMHFVLCSMFGSLALVDTKLILRLDVTSRHRVNGSEEQEPLEGRKL